MSLYSGISLDRFSGLQVKRSEGIVRTPYIDDSIHDERRREDGFCGSILPFDGPVRGFQRIDFSVGAAEDEGVS